MGDLRAVLQTHLMGSLPLQSLPPPPNGAEDPLDPVRPAVPSLVSRALSAGCRAPGGGCGCPGHGPVSPDLEPGSPALAARPVESGPGPAGARAGDGPPRPSQPGRPPFPTRRPGEVENW